MPSVLIKGSLCLIPIRNPRAAALTSSRVQPEKDDVRTVVYSLAFSPGAYAAAGDICAEVSMSDRLSCCAALVLLHPHSHLLRKRWNPNQVSAQSSYRLPLCRWKSRGGRRRGARHCV